MGERVLSVIDKTEPCSYSEAMIFSQSMAIDDKYNNIYVSNTNPPPLLEEGCLMIRTICMSAKLQGAQV